MFRPRNERRKVREKSIRAHPSFAKFLVGDTSYQGESLMRQRYGEGFAGGKSSDVTEIGRSIINRQQRPAESRFDLRPILVFWETTKACPLSCVHCRATALNHPQPGEMNTAQGKDLIRQIAEFGNPTPVLVLTGGDVLMRGDLEELVDYARSFDVRVALSPAVSDRIDESSMRSLFSSGVRSVSVSLDGIGATHDRVRGIPGHYHQTLDAVALLMDIGFKVQINTTVMATNVHDLPGIVQLMVDRGVKVWEVFFLVQVGRGTSIAELTRFENEDVSRFLYDVSGYDINVRTVEAPFYRRVVLNLREGAADSCDLSPAGDLYFRLKYELRERLGDPIGRSATSVARTRDGKGIVFVAHDGTVFPSGFLPLGLGNVKSQELKKIYRDSPLLNAIRSASFSGRCGQCNYRDICGGSRSRAFSYFQDPLASDPGCAIVGIGTN